VQWEGQQLCTPDKRRDRQQATGAERLAPTGMPQGRGAPRTPVVVTTLPAPRADLPHVGRQAERGKPVVLPLGMHPAREADGTAGTGRGSKRQPACHGVERGCAVATSPHAKAGRLPSGLSSRANVTNRLRRDSR
jgi:hypothetical protein